MQIVDRVGSRRLAEHHRQRGAHGPSALAYGSVDFGKLHRGIIRIGVDPIIDQIAVGVVVVEGLHVAVAAGVGIDGLDLVGSVVDVRYGDDSL